MKRNSLTRRLLAGATGLLIGAAGAVAFAAPAQATWGGDYGHKLSQAHFEDDCDGTWVFIHSGSFLHTYEWTVTVDDEVFEQLEFGKKEGDSVFVPAEAGTHIAVDFEQSPNKKWPKTWDWSEPEGCEDEEGEGGEQEPPALSDAVFFGCELFVFAFRNDGEEGDVEVSLTPTQEATHGHAPDLVDLIDDANGEVDLPEDFELDTESVSNPLGAGETFTFGPLGIGDAHAHGFAPSEGLEVNVVVAIDGEVAADEDVLWDELLDEEGIECDEGEGGEQEDEELPVTGMSSGLIALGAVVLLALGGGLYLVARRRRVTFTA